MLEGWVRGAGDSPAAHPRWAASWKNNPGLGVSLTKSDRPPCLQGVTREMYLAHSRCLTNDRGASWPLYPESIRLPKPAPDLATPPPSRLYVCSPSRGAACQAALTAGPHSHIVVPAASLGSVLLGPEAWRWGLSCTSILGQQESDLEVTPALAIVCCGSPSHLEEEGISEAGVSMTLVACLGS